jgi:phage major head subunit gpT-like protein
MPITTNVPDFLVVGATTGFLASLPSFKLPWQRIATQIKQDRADLLLVDLGAAPMPIEVTGRIIGQDFIEKTLHLKPRDWTITVHISKNAVDDDQTGTLYGKVASAGENFQRAINNMVFDALSQGNSTTSPYGLCYDGLAFFSASHVDKGAKYKTVQSNKNAYAALTVSNFKPVRAAALKYLDDQGEPVGHNPNLISVGPDLEYDASQICANPETAGTANRERNPYDGKIDYVVSPKIPTGEAYLTCESESVKPILFGLREAPNLQMAWFDPSMPEGGWYNFKLHARYNVAYGDWRLATKIN